LLAHNRYRRPFLPLWDTTNEVVDRFEELRAGEFLTVRNKKGWRFLEDMGYVRICGIPGEKIELIGVDAVQAFLFASEPNLRRVQVLGDLKTSQLVAAGVISSPESVSFLSSEEGPGKFDVNMQSRRYRRYVDLDDMGSAGMFGKSAEWVNDGLAATRASLSPEPDIDLDY
jgi:hypothetical protein